MTWRNFPPVGKKLVVFINWFAQELAVFRHFRKLA
jgi:hypothetical protein